LGLTILDRLKVVCFELTGQAKLCFTLAHIGVGIVGVNILLGFVPIWSWFKREHDQANSL
jgi:hypothetical protein